MIPRVSSKCEAELPDRRLKKRPTPNAQRPTLNSDASGWRANRGRGYFFLRAGGVLLPPKRFLKLFPILSMADGGGVRFGLEERLGERI
jgi:hypothetical protein